MVALTMAWLACNALRRRPALAAPLCFCFAVGYLCIQPWLMETLPADHVGQYAETGKCRVFGTIVQGPEMDDGRKRFLVRAQWLETADRPEVRLPVRGLIQVGTEQEVCDLQRGDTLILSGRLRAIHSFCNPGGFDYERHMALRGIRVRLFARPDRIELVSRGIGALRALDRFRGGLGERMRETLSQSHKPQTAAVLEAMTLGNMGGIDPELQDDFSRTGTGHILAISGLNIRMVAAAVFGPAAFLLSRFKGVLRRAWTRKGAAVITLLPIAGYSVIAGLSPSVVRAALMVAAFMLTFWVGRRLDPFNTLAAAALIILVFAPPAVTSISFQLSFAAVAALIIGMGKEVGGKPAPSGSSAPAARLTGWLSVSLRISLLSTLGTLPLTLLYFNLLSLVGPAINLVAVPLSGMIAVPAGMLGILLSLVNDGLAAFSFQVAAYSIDAMLWVIRKAADWPFAAFYMVTPSLVEMTLFYLLMAMLLNVRRSRLGYVGLAVVIACGIADAAFWSYLRFGRQEMIVTAIDVGQGTANLLQLPGGATVLIDGGGFSDNRSFDVGKRIVAPLLWHNKIKTIDLVILSHANSDHLNGLLFILETFKVRDVWSNHEGERSFGYRRFTSLIRSRGICHRPFADLAAGADLGRVRFEVLSPTPDFKKRRRAEPWRDLNNNSLVVRATYDQVSVLFTGDIGVKTEAELLSGPHRDKLFSRILLVPHHGSRKSSSKAFLEAVKAQEAVISAGWHNRFGFPHKDVLDRLAGSACRIRRTDLCGAVLITTDGRDHQVRTCREEQAEPQTGEPDGAGAARDSLQSGSFKPG